MEHQGLVDCMFMRRLGNKCRWAAVCVRSGWTRRTPTQAPQTVNFGLRNGRMAWKGREVGLKAGADHLQKASDGGRSITTQLSKAFHHSTRGARLPFSLPIKHSATGQLCLQVEYLGQSRAKEPSGRSRRAPATETVPTAPQSGVDGHMAWTGGTSPL